MDVAATDGRVATGEKDVADPLNFKDRLSLLINSPFLFIVLSLATVALGVKWYAVQASLKAPSISGWRWEQHPNSLLIYYPHTDCGCGPGLLPVLAEARNSRLDTLVITDVQGSDLVPVNKAVSDEDANLAYANAEKLRSLSSSTNAVLVRIRNGRILRRAAGTSVPITFFR